jgi:hypothetical protein
MNPFHSVSAVLAALIAAVMGGCAALLQAPPDPAVPAALNPAGEKQRLRVSARGVQVYVCQRADGAAPAWKFIEPEAELFDEQGRPFASHGAGPSWQARDGSRIVGTVVAKVDAPRGDVIAWLLLRSRSSGGDGRLAGVTSVQRIHTDGGMAPTTACDEATLGQTARVPYTAQYTFFEADPVMGAASTERSGS